MSQTTSPPYRIIIIIIIIIEIIAASFRNINFPTKGYHLSMMVVWYQINYPLLSVNIKYFILQTGSCSLRYITVCSLHLKKALLTLKDYRLFEAKGV